MRMGQRDRLHGQRDSGSNEAARQNNVVATRVYLVEGA
jgi:hypothetical protein